MTERAKLVRRLPMVAWLLLVWVVLWGSLKLGTVLLGALVAVGVVALFRMPSLSAPIVLRPVRFLWLVAFLGYELVSSAVSVGWYALRRGGRPGAAIVAVPVLSDVDHVIALAANLISLAPGKFVLQIDRDRRLFYVYALEVETPAQLRDARRAVFNLQARVLRAFGPAAEVRALAARDETEGT